MVARSPSLWRPHVNEDLDIVRALYTRRKANVTEALMINPSVVFQIFNTTVDVVINSIHAKNQSLINLLCPQIPNWMSPYLFQFLIDGNAFFCLMGRELFRDQYRFNSCCY